ncbi:MAG: hypothetical protein U0T33_02245 [Bacteroidales bacterium]
MSIYQKLSLKFWLTAFLSMLTGMLIAWIDARPGWDDTGITVAMLYLASALAGFITPQSPWLWALLTGLWIPVAAINRTGDVLMLIVLLVTFGGAYSGYLLHRIVFPER